MTDRPFFSIVICSLNGGGVIRCALDAVRATEYDRFETIVVDNGSTDNLAEIVRVEYPEVRLIQSPVNLGFAGGNNLGLRAALGDMLVLLNDDAEPRSGWLEAWARAAREHPAWGILGAKLLYPDGRTIQHAGGVVETNGLTHHFGYEQPDDGRFDEVLRCDYITGAAMAIRRDLAEQIGFLDDKYFPIYFEEADYCWQARRIGYEVLYIPDAVVIHHESRTQVRYSFRFIFRYTRCRMRFLCKCFSRADLLRAARVEARWWLRPYSYQCYWPFFCGYVAGLLQLPRNLKDRFPFHRRMEELSDRNRPRLEAAAAKVAPSG